jgi:uncharacterized protein
MNYEKTGNPLHDDMSAALDGLQQRMAASDWRMLPADSLHGFLTAVAIGPRMLVPSQWLPRVFFNDTELPVFDDEDEAREVMRAVIKIFTGVLQTIQDNTFSPFVTVTVENGKEEQNLSLWCSGFALGTYVFDPDEWDLSNDRDLAELCLPIFFNAETDRLRQTFSPEQLKRMDACRDEAGDLIIDAVYDIQEYFSDMQEPPAPMPLKHEEPKIGRNEPCPCGSGKKYKKCCGGKEG